MSKTIFRLETLKNHLVWKSVFLGLQFPLLEKCTFLTSNQTSQKHQNKSYSSVSSPKRSYLHTMDGQRTAGIIIIGDEILKGQTLDTNSNFMCKKLFSFGVKVQKISVICDDVDTIAREVAEFSEIFTHVITSGGIGPTHDDMTFEGVAKAFNLRTEPHPRLVQLIKDWFKTEDMDSPEMKMAKIPKTSTLSFGVDPKTQKESKYPLVSVNNVYMFPGVPQLFERAFTMLGPKLFRNHSMEFHTEKIYVNKDEVSVATHISRVAEKYKADVIIGSYPEIFNSYYKVKLSLESTNPNRLQEAYMELCSAMPAGSVVTFDPFPVASAVTSVYALVDDAIVDPQDIFLQVVKQAVATLEKAIETYGLDDICIGFNGGKDCTVLLHLFHAVAKKKFPNHKKNLQALYIRSRSPFPEVEKFVEISRDNYDLEMIHYDGSIKESMATLLQKRPNIKAVIMGTRSTDPHASHLTSFSPTDEGWPQVMRVNPVLDWSYTHIWTFLRRLNVPYCMLYDQGYSSLGSLDNTHPNPRLQYVDDRGHLAYRPAYTLLDGGSERDGRNT